MAYTQDEFLTKVSELHNKKYDYSLVTYKNISSKIEIICPIHGSFFQRAGGHLKGYGCRLCARKLVGEKCSWTKEIFLEKAKKVHGNKYLYDKVDFKNGSKKIVLTCKEHGDFSIRPTAHIRNIQGCKKCRLSKGERLIMTELEKQNIIYETQKEFDNCISKKNHGIKLKFDFYLPKQNYCIEFDGPQHFTPIKRFGGIKYLKYIKLNDSIKNIFCKNNNVGLLRIKFTNIKNISSIVNSIL